MFAIFNTLEFFEKSVLILAIETANFLSAISLNAQFDQDK